VKRDDAPPSAHRWPQCRNPMPHLPLLTLGGFSFSRDELGAPSLVNGERLVFAIPPTDANGIALVPVSRGLST